MRRPTGRSGTTWKTWGVPPSRGRRSGTGWDRPSAFARGGRSKRSTEPCGPCPRRQAKASTNCGGRSAGQSREARRRQMARRKGTNGSDVQTLEPPPPPEGLPDTTAEEQEQEREDALAVEHGETLDIRALHEIKIPQLLKIAKDLEVENATGMRKQDLIFKI